MEKLLVGTSGFYNRQWKGIFYPEELASKDWFAYYCEQFDTFEINASFYKFPTLKTMRNWYAKCPRDFVYSVKAPKSITHQKRFEDCHDEILQFYEICSEGLVEKLGALLFQLPPSFAFSMERLELLLESLDPAMPNVVEFRHASWWRDDVKRLMQQSNIVFCTPGYPGLPHHVIKANGIAYIRLHGTPKLFYSGYSESDLRYFLSEAQEAKKAFIFFNNTAGIQGIENAVLMKTLSQNALSLRKPLV